MENKKDRLLLESEVIATVDKHTNSYNRLDDDITCIFEEVQGGDVEVANKHKGDIRLSFGIPTQPTVPPMPEVKKNNGKFQKIKDLLDEFEEIMNNNDNTLRIISKPENGYYFKLAYEFYKNSRFNCYTFCRWLEFLIDTDFPSSDKHDIIKFLKEKYGVEE